MVGIFLLFLVFSLSHFTILRVEIIETPDSKLCNRWNGKKYLVIDQIAVYVHLFLIGCRFLFKYS